MNIFCSDNMLIGSNTANDASIKHDFLRVSEFYLLYPNTQEVREKIYREYFNFFTKWDLNDLQYNIVKKDDHCLEFKPVRKIDELAILGILNS